MRPTKPATPAAVADATNLGSAATIPPPPSGEVTDARMEPGSVVEGRYRIARVLGEGGMGVVYAAEHVLMRKEVALKVLHADMCRVPDIVARFEREAIAAAHIDHPNVAGATDFGRLPDGSCYLVLELLRGTSLRDVLESGALPIPRALRIARGIAAGIDAAHAKGIVHRDLKPENVMLVERDGDPDFVKVLDFGIAKLDPTVASGKVLTRFGMIFGTPEYMAPEQAAGDVVDARADLYALGVILFEMVTGRSPFEGDLVTMMRERIFAGPPDVSAVPDATVRDLVTRLMQRQVEDRIQSAGDVLAILDAANGGAPVPAPVTSAAPAALGASPSTSTSTSTSTRRIGVIASVAALAMVAGAAIVIGVTKRGAGTISEADTKIEATAASVTVEAAEPSEAPTTDTPAPKGSAASARAPRKSAPQKRPAPKKTTGPGGLYIPPPEKWFK